MIAIIFNFYTLLLVTSLLVSKRISIGALFLIFPILLLYTFFYKTTRSDWWVYRRYFESCDYLNCSYFEVSFDILLFVANKIDIFEIVPIFSLFLLFLVLLIATRYHKHNSSIIILSIIPIFLMLYFGGLRQSIALSIISLLVIIPQPGLPLSILLYFLAGSFHYSSFAVGLLFILARRISSTKLSIITVIVFSTLLLSLSYPLVNYLGIDERLRSLDWSTNYARGLLKETLLYAERILILLFSVKIFKQEKYIDPAFVLIAIFGSITFLIFNPIFPGATGRVLASLRIFDIYVIFYFFRNFFTFYSSFFLISIYMVSKFYFGVIRTGIFLPSD